MIKRKINVDGAEYEIVGHHYHEFIRGGKVSSYMLNGKRGAEYIFEIHHDSHENRLITGIGSMSPRTKHNVNYSFNDQEFKIAR